MTDQATRQRYRRRTREKSAARQRGVSESASVAPARTAEPQQQAPASTPNTVGRWPYVVAALAAGLCWTGALSLLLLANLHVESNPLAPQRALFYGLVLAAGLLTFGPVQYALRLPGLTFTGVVGMFCLLYTLAFVPPPTGWLLSLPDLPVYALFVMAVFLSTSALVLPFVYASGQRIFKNRARRMDVPRARRQAYEIGALCAGVAVLAALNVLTWVSVLLLVFILVTAELLFLSLFRVGGRRR